MNRRSSTHLHPLVALALLGAAPVADAPGSISPERAYDLLSLHLDITVDPDSRTVQGTARYSARPLHEGPLVLDRVDVDILAVRSLHGAAPPHRTRPGQLVIHAEPEHLGEDGTLDIEVDFAARPWTGVHFRGGSPDAYAEAWTQGQRSDHRHWFPGWDHPSDRFDYTGTVSAPDGWRATTNSGHDLPNYLIMFAAGEYDEVVHPEDPTTKVWVPPGTHPEAVSSVLGPVPAMKAHFAERTGQAYPWGDYLQVFVQRFLYFGMENTGATINAARALTDDRVARTRPRVENLIAHELAHQWFGDLLTCRTWPDLWLNEGFATYMAGDYVAQRHTTPAEQDAAWAELVLQWHDRSKAQPQPMARRWHHGPGPDAHNVYSRGAATLWMLNAELGDDAFWKGVQTYVSRHAHGPVETVDLRRAMEDTTGRDLSGFFQQWTERTGSPKFVVSDKRQGDTLVVTVKQQATGEQPLFHVPVRVDVGTADGTVSATDWMDDDTLQLRLPVEGDVDWVAIDPAGAVVGTWTHKQSAARLEAQALAAAPVARLRAIHALAEKDASAALAAIVADPTEPLPYRAAAAKSLGAQRSTKALLGAVDSDDDAVRYAVAEALGHCPEDTSVAALDRLVRTDPNPDVRAAALTALGKVAPTSAVRHARGVIRLPDREHTWLVTAGANVLGKHGTARDLTRLTRPDLPYRNRVQALRAAATWVQAQHDPAVRQAQGSRVARATEPLLADLDLRTRQAAIDILGKVGDEASVSPLEAHLRATRVKQESKAARAAITKIQSRKRPDHVSPSAKTAAELEALEDRIHDLEKRLEEWEDRP